jgi:hypothetical protein
MAEDITDPIINSLTNDLNYSHSLLTIHHPIAHSQFCFTFKK